MAYLRDDAENYWPAAEGDDDLTDPFSPGLGLHLFQAAHARLDALGVRVPAIRLVDRDGAHCPADLAIIEDLPGENLEQLLARDPRAAAPVMARLREALEAMRRHRTPTYGKVAVVDGGGTSRGTSCELGPDHVLVDPDGNPVLIDIEGSMHFDVEWEHVFLRIRLHDAYRPLGVDGLDEDRLALYMLAQRLSLTAGPLRLLDGDFPDQASTAGIAEYNLQKALELVHAGEAVVDPSLWGEVLS
ncbi:aminoglycoside phosphotransferase family protein [Streptomyces sp. NPDC059862]|uniref:aminoglycoside phosphotransferase family protein n=1 Tax=Streptomyces sp. NPDC059862 TaxID=3346975 RepID=UPI00365F7F9A